MQYLLKGKSPIVHSSNFCAQSAEVIGDVVLGENTSVWFQAVLRGDNDTIKVGKGSNIQDGAIIHVDEGFPVTIGENVTVGHRAILHGCTIKDNALVGMGAIVLNGAIIGEGALVAAGAVVGEGKVVEPGMLVAGIPAKPIKKLDNHAEEMMLAGARHYIEKGNEYKEQLTKCDIK